MQVNSTFLTKPEKKSAIFCEVEPVVVTWLKAWRHCLDSSDTLSVGGCWTVKAATLMVLHCILILSAPHVDIWFCGELKLPKWVITTFLSPVSHPFTNSLSQRTDVDPNSAWSSVILSGSNCCYCSLCICLFHFSFLVVLLVNWPTSPNMIWANHTWDAKMR